jgi:heat shock protein HtpX
LRRPLDLQGGLFAFLLSTLWAGNPIATKAALEDAPPLRFGWMRFGLGLVVMLVWAAVTRQTLKVQRHELRPMATLGLLFAVGVNWILILVIAVLMAGFQYFFSDKLVLMATRARIVTPEQEPKLHATIERLSAAAGISKPKKVAIMETHVPNAFATGRNPKNAVVAVTTGIVNRLSDAELEAVLAHELTHVRNRDVTVITLASFFATVASMIVQNFMWMSMFGGHGSDRRDRGTGAVMLIFLVSLLVYIISFFLIRALSRYREYAADRGGALLTGQPETLASALLRISGRMGAIPQQDLRRVEQMNAFFIVPALTGEAISELLSTHPPLEKRIARLERLQRELEGA